MHWLIPNLPIFLTLISNLSHSVLVLAEPPAVALSRPRGQIDRRSELQWPAARAHGLESAVEELSKRQSSEALVERQDYYAFSGAIYIVGENGQSLSGLNAASPAYCPNSAPQSCGNIGVWNWCCPSGNTCGWADAAHTYVGCCPTGVSCSQGSVNINAIQTVTVYVTTTQWQHPNQVTTVVAAGGHGGPTTTTQQQGQGGGGIVIVGETTGLATYNGYCTTIYAQDIGRQPTTAAADCGIALVVNHAVRPVARQVLGIMVAFWLCIMVVSVAPFRMRK